MSLPGWHQVHSPAQALAIRRNLGPQARYLAGGTALQLSWPRGRADHPVVDLSKIDFGPDVTVSEGRLLLSAGARLEDLRHNRLVSTHLPDLCEAIGLIGALSVRHLATLGGNLAWGAGDLVPLLMVLDAQVREVEREPRSLVQFLEQPCDDLLVAVEVPLRAPASIMFEKVTSRAAFAPSLVTVAASMTDNGPRLAVGGGPVPPRLLSTSAVSQAQTQGEARTFPLRLAQLIPAPSDDFASGSYRSRTAANLLANFVSESSCP